MNLPRGHIHPRPNTKSLLPNLPTMQPRIILGISNCQGTPTDKMGRETAMRVGGVVGVTRYCQDFLQRRIHVGTGRE